MVDDHVQKDDDTTRHASKRAFVDRMIVQARAGHGGHGCASARKTRSRSRKVQPDGGNGGDGGNVVLKASKKVKSLVGLPQWETGQ
jgi:GTPase involved in cell partitioning and DNA repair